MDPLIVNGIEYTFADLLDSVVDGVCGECGETTGGHEPDARDNVCSCCGASAVASVAVILGVL